MKQDKPISTKSTLINQKTKKRRQIHKKKRRKKPNIQNSKRLLFQDLTFQSIPTSEKTKIQDKQSETKQNKPISNFQRVNPTHGSKHKQGENNNTCRKKKRKKKKAQKQGYPIEIYKNIVFIVDQFEQQSLPQNQYKKNTHTHTDLGVKS